MKPIMWTKRRMLLVIALVGAAGLGATSVALGAPIRPERRDAVEQAFSDVSLVKGRNPVSPGRRTDHGRAVTYSFKADYAAAAKTVGRELTSRGWTPTGPAQSKGSIAFAKGRLRLTISNARTTLERCPRTGQTWQRTRWPADRCASSDATEDASKWITVECVLLDLHPSVARCSSPVRT